MVSADKLKIGDVVYTVEERNNAFSKQKIKMVDSDGIEWFRYDKANWEYSICPIVYCGRVDHILTGEVEFDLDNQTQLHFKYPKGAIYYEYAADISEMTDWFYTQEEAEAYAEQQRKIRAGEE